ncbi:hypothetical protein WJX84_003819 [Apatococcus fuscideae]|uniref:Rab3-GAP regulatory subunit N-terminal domain-containing protein n=1 Tax=Apatococcus fuscideae TaxID=2026836 RepID=A0AAW1T0J5_9CHLO
MGWSGCSGLVSWLTPRALSPKPAAGPSEGGPAVSPRPAGEPLPASSPSRLVASLTDEHRGILFLIPAPRGTLAVAGDSLGRILLVDLAMCLVLRIWKAYRHAQAAWLMLPVPIHFSHPDGTGQRGAACRSRGPAGEKSSCADAASVAAQPHAGILRHEGRLSPNEGELLLAQGSLQPQDGSGGHQMDSSRVGVEALENDMHTAEVTDIAADIVASIGSRALGA